jgi:hypothetical protein
MSVQAGTLPVNQSLFTQQHSPTQSPFMAQTPYQQGYIAQFPIAALTPHAQGQFGQQWPSAAPAISEATLRVVSAALATLIEQVRTDPPALQMLCTQGQLTPQAYANVLVESARRSAPVVASAISAITPGIGQPIGAMAYGMQQYAQQPPIGQQYGWQTPFGPANQPPFGHFG